MTNTTIGGDLFTPEKIKNFHKELIDSSNLPNWLVEIPCAICGKEIGGLGIRNVSFCLNAARIGDIEVGVSCKDCAKGYSFFFRNACKNLDEFFLVLKSPIQPSVPEAQMNLTLQDNNLLEQMIELHEKGLWNENKEG